MTNFLNSFLPLEELNTILDMFKGYNLLGFIIAGFINAFLMIFIGHRFFEALQQCGYKGGQYFKWLKKRDNTYLTRLLMLSMLSVLGFLLVNMALSFIDHYLVSYAGFIAYFMFLIVYVSGEAKRKSKVPLVLTKRMVRMIVTFTITVIVLSLILVFGINLIAIPFKENLLSNFRYAVLCLCPILVPYLVLLAYLINKPIEKSINKKYIVKCTETLDRRSDLIKIAITGSYGKTSVKQILSEILSKKYTVLSTPESYNTAMGISKTVNRLEDKHQIFIAEMGARHVGDIKELSDIVKPNFAVITGITYQHLETFGSIENVIKTKSEILNNFSGEAIISADNKHTLKIYDGATCNKCLAGVCKTGDSLVYAEDLAFNENGSTFTMVSGDKKVKTSTKLLGKANVHNVLLAVAVALKLGFSLEEIASILPALEQIPHRLQLSVNANGVYIIDDGYNSNPEGIKNAINLLNSFSGRKYVVTPGLIELGHAESGFNYKIGELLSDVCDGVILVGRSGSLQIREGLLSKEYPQDKIFMAKNLNASKEILINLLKAGDVVLFENDLPDIFS